ncbi:MAG TPA: hypothetical protein VI094_16755 [Propionibacteriaceae bacterium]
MLDTTADLLDDLAAKLDHVEGVEDAWTNLHDARLTRGLADLDNARRGEFCCCVDHVTQLVL